MSKMSKFLVTVVWILITMATAGAAEKMTCIVPETQYVRIRTSPSTSGAVYDRMHYGDEIDVTAVVDGFVKFAYEGVNCYASVDFFESYADIGKYLISANGRVAKRAKPDGKRTGWLNPGIKIDVIAWRYSSDGTRWAMVYGGSFVSSAYLEEVHE